MIRTTCEALIFAAVLMTTTSQDRTGKGKEWSFLTRHKQENKTRKTQTIAENNLHFVNLFCVLAGNEQIHIHSFSLKIKAKFKNTA